MSPRGKAGAGVGRGRRTTPPARRALDVLQSAPEALQAVFENSPDVVMIVDRARRIQYINRYFPPFEPGRVLGVDATLFASPENRPSMTAALDRVFREGVPDRYELDGPGPAGTLVFYESRVVPILRDGGVAAALVTSVDVTERRRAERTQMATFRISAAAHTAPTLGELYEAIHRIVGELMPARNFYIALYDARSDLISFPYFVDEYDPPFPPKKPGRGVTEYVLRSGQSLLLTPERAEDLTRRGEVELIGAPSIDWLGVPLTIRGATIGALVVQSYVEHVRYAEAEQRILEFVSSQVAMAIQHKRSEEALRESEMTLKSIVDAIPETALLLNLDGTIAAANRAVLEGDPRSPEELVGRMAFQFSAADLSDHRRSRVEEVVRTGQAARWEDTSAITGRTHINYVHPVRDAAGKVARIAIFALDITERKRAEEALRRSEEQYRTLVDGARDVIFALSPDGICTALNPAFESISGWTRDEWLGRPFAELLHPDDVIAAYEIFARVLRGEERATAQLRFRTRSGEYLVGEVHANLHQQDGVVLGALGIARDVTDRVRLEDQLRQAQKMEAVGRLAGGVAHDFNNLLTAIGGYSDLLLADLATADPRRGDVEEIKKATERAAALTRQLLAFSRRQVLQPKVLDLNAVIVGAENLLRRLIGEHIRLETRLASGLGAVRADAGQVEQVVMNLAVNARDAMREGGTLTVETANVQIGAERRTAEQAPMPPGRYVELRVSDSGAGIDAETKRHLFEPFFTTREMGKGTGLGLATVYGIVKQSGGFIWVDSEPGRGATFTIDLPWVDEAVQPAEPGRTVRGEASGTETILVVEDEPAVRNIARESLRVRGYTVLEAPDGDAALLLAAGGEGGRAIDLLLTDVVMPGLSGRALAERLVAQRPGLRVLYMSGYTDDAIGLHGVLEPGLHYLQKPFAPDVLARKVRDVLDGAR